jgi:hypothetical protein
VSRLGWDPNPTMTGIPAWRQKHIASFEQVMAVKYARYADCLDHSHPTWHFDILPAIDCQQP